ncbi:mitogen-activated protein kinase kinase kinase [Trifolium repens]|nr:mitogen-activated protein kinase kinase kinase [Trifolium repens]
MIEQNMCKDIRVGCDDQNSKECLKKINQMMNNDDINEEMQDFEEENM